ncbi:hypothetical protein EDB83DRAFT_2317651 [Lactarius deliciosus]|nr:hypothetical protein EDB83DRAFT_2317651 [Lactarius deliciosus]
MLQLGRTTHHRAEAVSQATVLPNLEPEPWAIKSWASGILGNGFPQLALAGIWLWSQASKSLIAMLLWLPQTPRIQRQQQRPYALRVQYGYGKPVTVAVAIGHAAVYGFGSAIRNMCELKALNYQHENLNCLGNETRPPQGNRVTMYGAESMLERGEDRRAKPEAFATATAGAVTNGRRRERAWTGETRTRRVARPSEAARRDEATTSELSRSARAAGLTQTGFTLTRRGGNTS